MVLAVSSVGDAGGLLGVAFSGGCGDFLCGVADIGVGGVGLLVRRMCVIFASQHEAFSMLNRLNL